MGTSNLQGYYSISFLFLYLISYRKHILRTSAGYFILFYTFAPIAITIYIIFVCRLAVITYLWLNFPTPAIDTWSIPTAENFGTPLSDTTLK